MQLLAAIALTATLYLPLVGGSNVAFPNNPVIDDFNRADEMPTSLNWEDVYGLTVRSNQAVGSDPYSSLSFWNPGIALGANVDAYVTIPVIDIGTAKQAYVYARYDVDAETGYSVRANYYGGGGNDVIVIHRWDGAGGETSLATYNVTLADGDAFGIRCDGNNISAYHYTLGAWALLGTVVDATYPGTALCGLGAIIDGAGTSTIPLDDFGCGNEGGGAFPVPGVVDDFNRVDQGPPPGSDWVDQYVMGVVSNQMAARQTPNDYETPMLWRLTIAQDQEAYATIPIRQNDGNEAIIFLRYFDYSNNLALYITRDDIAGDTADIFETVAGLGNTIGGPYAITYQDGDSFGIAAYGTTVEAWYKPVAGMWTLLGSGITTLPLAVGQIGLDAFDTTVRFDDFGGGPYAPPVPPGPWRQGTGRAKSGGTRQGKIQDVAAYSITTPDGITTDLRDKGFTVGIGDIQDGMGMPPTEHKTWNLYNNPGALLRSVQVGPRIVTINASLNADCLQSLHDLRNKLFQALRWNRTLDNPPAPAVLHYTINGKRADLYVHYMGDVTARIGNSNVDQTVGVRLIAYDPLWYSPTQKTAALGTSATLPVDYIAGKMTGAWSALGLGGGLGTGTVRALALSNDGTILYVGGIFVNWNGIANADNIVQYNITTGVWSALGTGVDNSVYALAVGPDGTLYVGGIFHNAGGGAALHVASYTDAGGWAAMGAGCDDNVNALAIDRFGTLYIGGAFHNAGGAGALHIVSWTSAGGYAAMGAGCDDVVHSLAAAGWNVLYIGGDFANAGGIATAYIAQYDIISGTYAAMSTGTNGRVRAIAIAPNGLVYIGGSFGQASGVTVNAVAYWNGFVFKGMNDGVSGGLGNGVYTIAIAPDGSVWVSGDFDTAGVLDLTDGIAIWNGQAWSMFDINFPGAAVIYALALHGSNRFVGFSTSGNATVSSVVTTINTTGDFKTYPVITITGPGTLQHIINETSGEKLLFNLVVNPGETITIDLASGVKSITSDWAIRPGTALGLELPQSDLGSLALEPDPVAAGGNNSIAVLITDTTGDTDVNIYYYDRHLSVDHAVQ